MFQKKFVVDINKACATKKYIQEPMFEPYV